MEVHCGFNETSKITDKIEHLGSSLGFSYDVFILVYLAVPIITCPGHVLACSLGRDVHSSSKGLVGKFQSAGPGYNIS